MSKIWVAFGGNANLENVERGLDELLSKHPDATFYCCFLTKEVVTKEGFDPGAVDLLERKLGDRLEWLLKDYKSLDEVKPDLDKKRFECARICDKLCVLDSDTAKGVTREIEVMSNLKIILM